MYTVTNFPEQKIILTRGDTFRAKITIRSSLNEPEYNVSEGDQIRFCLKKYVNDKTPILIKNIPTDSLILEIESNDTSNLNFGEYRYEVELTTASGDVCTIIENRVFHITPELLTNE